jgi:nucleoside-diphosphate-sugar epimerase
VRILVTGSQGFIGKHLVGELLHGGHTVSGTVGDLLEPGVADNHVRAEKPDVVVHLAAKTGRLFGEEDPAETVMANAAMTVLVAQACARHNARLVYASTSEIYGDWGNYEFPLKEQWGGFGVPHNLYGLTKRWGEEACKLYAPDNLTILRLSMPYGPGQPHGRPGYHAAITTFLHLAAKRQPIPVHQGAERSWCYITDTVQAVRAIVESGREGVWNVGRDDDPRPMLAVAEIACDLTAAPRTLIRMVDPPARQTLVKRLSTEKLRSLGWRPTVGLEDGMARTLDWLRDLEQQAA